MLSYHKPLWQYLPSYLLLSLMGILFGLINFTLLIPLLEVLFQSDALDATPALVPSRTLDVKAYFDYYFRSMAYQYGASGALQFVCGVIGVSVFLASFFRYFAFRLINGVRIRIVEKLRGDVYGHLTRLHLGYFTNERKGDLMSRMTNDVQEVENSLVNSLRSAFKGPLTIIVYFLALFYISFKLSIFTFIFLPISGGIIAELTKRLKRHGKQSQDLLGQLLGVVDETLSGIKIIKAFTAEDTIKAHFLDRNQRYARVSLKTENKRDLASPLSEFLGVLVMIGIILYGGSLVLDQELSPETFIAYLAIFSQIIAPIKTFSNMLGQVQRGIASAERLLELLAVRPHIMAPPNPVPLNAFREAVHFERISFAYDERKALDNICFTLHKGEVVALVGPSGGGKSTLANLLPRFYDPTQGRILLDGHDIRDYNPQDLRQLMGIVTQDAILFNDTVFKNIAFGKPTATEAEVMAAARVAHAHDFIQDMPEGYQTNIGDGGIKLSGGQRQRLSIARAVLKDPAILILDEATSALDSESEQLVQAALQELMKNRTSLVIAHRLSTIQKADRILVIQEGQIIEQGTHQELLNQNGLYHKLVNMQRVHTLAD